VGSLEDQLKQWKKKTQQAPQPAKPSNSSSEPARKRPTKQDPFPKQTLKKAAPEKPAPPPPKKKSDAELFAEAVANVDEDVVLEKFSAAPTSSSKSSKDRPPPLTDEELFAQFVGEDNAAAEAEGGKKSTLKKLKK
jgi:hypothetical protein